MKVCTQVHCLEFLQPALRIHVISQYFRLIKQELHTSTLTAPLFPSWRDLISCVYSSSTFLFATSAPPAKRSIVFDNLKGSLLLFTDASPEIKLNRWTMPELMGWSAKITDTQEMATRLHRSTIVGGPRWMFGGTETKKPLCLDAGNRGVKSWPPGPAASKAEPRQAWLPIWPAMITVTRKCGRAALI